MIRVLFAFTLAAILTHSSAHAVAITGLNAGLTTSNAWTLNAAPTIATGAEGNDDFISPGNQFGFNPNSIALDFTVTDKFVSDVVTLDVSTLNPLTTEYEFAVTVTYTGQGAMNGFDLRIINAAADASFSRFENFDPLNPRFTSTSTGTAFPFAFETPNLSPVLGSGPIRFGGLSGGGGHLIDDGSTVTSFFTIDVGDAGVGLNQTLALEFTANPEPSAAALALCALGPVLLRRRRRQAVVA